MSEDKKSPLQKYEKQWQLIEKLLNEGSVSDYKIAVIETERSLQSALDEKKFPGKNISQQIKNAKIIIRNPEKLEYSRAMHQRIITESNFDISSEDIKEIEMGYYQAIADIIKMNSKDISSREKVNLFLQKYFYGFPNKIRKNIILSFVFFLAIFLSTETTTGRFIFEILSDFSKFVFYKVIPGIIALLVLGIFIIGGLYYWQSRKE